MTNFAQGNLLRIALVPEVTPGVVPSSPAFQIMRFTKPGGGFTKQTFTSQEMTGNRYGRKVYQTGVDVALSYDLELSYGSFDALLESAFQGAWATNVLKDGATRKYFTAEEADTGQTSTFFRYHGLLVDELSLSIQSRKEITGSVKFFGMTPSDGSTALSGATYTAANTKDVMTAGLAVGNLSLSALTNQPLVKSIDFSLKNGLAAREKLGSLYSMEPTSSPVEIEATIEAYVQDVELYEATVAHGNAALSFQLGMVSTEKYQIDLPNARLTTVDRERPGYKGDQMLKIVARAEYDGTLGATAKITRAVA